MRTLSKIQVTFLTITLIVAIPFSTYAVDGQIKIGQTASTTFPIQITLSGSYVLTSNITVSTINVNGIEINADNVTLDLNGHALIGPGSGSSGYGIYANNRNNISVINGVVRDFIETGIWCEGSNHQVKDIRVSNNGVGGITVVDSIVTNCTAYNNGDGISAFDSIITNCTANDNTGLGIQTNNSTIISCTANDNGGAGIWLQNNSTITNCTANDNVGDGISAWYRSTITNCTAYQNGANGILVGSSIVTNCTANANVGDGIDATNYCRIEGNNLRHNGVYGIHLNGSRHYVIKNTASNNTSGNFQDDGSNDYMPTVGDNANYGW